jgi:hypothetical protein
MNKPAPFGYCPECHAKGLKREKRFNGNDTCQNGHVYKSCHNLSFVPDPEKIIESIKNALTSNKPH